MYLHRPGVRVGIVLLAVFATALLALGTAYLLLAGTSTLLPGDIRYLGMDKPDLCRQAGCQITDFITHNRAAYGGAIVASGLVAGWLVWAPMRTGESWAWWTLLAAGALQCACSIGFIAYGHTQAYGFGAWHVAAVAICTVTLAVGLALTRSIVGGAGPFAALRKPGSATPAWSAEGRARVFFICLALGLVISGLSVLLVALTTVFVSQDVDFLGLNAQQLGAVSERLLALVAHDRAEFGLGMTTTGILLAAVAWKGIGAYGRSLWLVVAAAGSIHFNAVLVSHFLVGYTDFIHLAPVYGAATLFAMGLGMWRPRTTRSLGAEHLAAQVRSTAMSSSRPSI